ncbi:fimbria/pilus outer membrane usher protein [Pseudomonas sp. Au-Pse12]|uniref:fimbria/pilus outer membrane usher protein n=1 Tax=Pseudomonas sp. Au-Pse12 TaxID=2906459 RepID=UPI001E5A099B|nr:fimbria/pilus outer membrane usher protein [Pseudomonas sp. Au-Pse12]MCE4057183.1 fimbria/pilus outer membrane usher protein [Pseudomonas sp. Au-Pse12]
MNASKTALLATAVTICFSYCDVSLAVDFNLEVMDVDDRGKIDLSHFSAANYIPPGKYIMSIRVNDRKLAERSLNFYPATEDERATRACVPAELVSKLGLKQDALEALGHWHQQECVDLESLSGVTLRPDMRNSTLLITIPQAWIEYFDPNWSSMDEWDNGIAGALLDYSVNTSISKHQGSGGSQQTSGNGTAGVNIEAWRLRGDFQGSHQRSNGYSSSDFTWTNLYAFRPIPSLGAKLQVGENQLNSNLFDSFRYMGVNLVTDDQMLPPNLRGYAPEVSGVVDTSARVTVKQGERVLYETIVPPGPFRIRDLNSAVSGKLDVEITQDDGRVQRYQMETANLPYLSRPGHFRYNLTMGRPSNHDREMTDPLFLNGDLSWGLNSDWSVFGGALITSGYTALATGLGRNLHQFGVVSLDITHATAEVPKAGRYNGSSLRLNYAKRFDEYNSEITFAGYRFSQRNFMSMDEFIRSRDEHMTIRNSKAVYTVLANKSFIDLGFSGHLSYTREDYWEQKSTERFSTFLSRYFDIGRMKGVSATLALSHSRSSLEKDSSLSLSVSVPFGNGQRIGYDTFASRDSIRHGASYSKYERERNYLVSANTGGGGDGVQGYFNQRGSMADVSMNGSYQEQGGQSLGLSLQGGATVTAQGAALHRSAFNGASRIMLDTDGIADVPLQNGSTYTNAMGIAVLPVVNDYYRTDVRIDMNKLADDMEARKSVTEATLTEGAIGYRKLSVIQGAKAVVTMKMPDGSYPPFGASVYDAQGREVAIVADNGFAYLTGITADSVFEVRWGAKKQCQVMAPKQLTAEQRYELSCTPFQ